MQTTRDPSAPPPAPAKQSFGRPVTTPPPEQTALRFDADAEIEGAGRVTIAAAAAAAGTFLPWHSISMPELSISASGLDTGVGIAALCGAIACALLTWSERSGVLPLQRNHALLGAMLGGGLAALMYALHWNDTRNPIFGALIGTTAWFYLGFAAAAASAFFAFVRMRAATK